MEDQLSGPRGFPGKFVFRELSALPGLCWADNAPITGKDTVRQAGTHPA